MNIDFSTMDGYQFEDYISSLFRRLGFDVEATGYSNDGGVDLVATFNQPIFSGKYIIQCKNWTGPVGQPEVRDLYGVVMDQRANKGILITPSDYTQQAYDFAQGKNIELINGAILRELLTVESQVTLPTTASKGLMLFRNERYTYYQNNIIEEPNNISNYLQIIDFLLCYVKEQNKEICTLELFDDIIVWIDKLINRCFKSPSKEDDRKAAALLKADLYIFSGRLAEATEILLKYNLFFYKQWGLLWNCGGYYSWYGVHACNLYTAYKYIDYKMGYNLILPSIQLSAWKNQQKSSTETKIIENIGFSFFYTTLKLNSKSGKSKHLSGSGFAIRDMQDPDFFYKNFYQKAPEEYAQEIDTVLKLHGIK